MSVLSYLQSLAGDALHWPGEKKKVTQAVDKLASRIKMYFGDEVVEHFKFGSTIRGTSLPKVFSDTTDVDYLVAFADRSFKPKTLIQKLVRFAEEEYPRNVVYQSSPAVVIEMSAVTFELVPAQYTLIRFFHDFRIPNSSATDWVATNPRGFEEKLVARNGECHHKLKAAIRLAKVWNVENNHVFSSYRLETLAVEGSYSFDSNLRDYFRTLMLNLPEDELDEKWRVKRLQLGKARLSKALELEKAGDIKAAEKVLDDFFGVN
ncbi:SMODS domain-containing nucleotidyltransferase [Caenimonas soli]|uniref:SMODS domain-containing nucleotidyltransferase n=1 Tax=Caenimonas soli TaxID=2735555 RepID=UPI0015553FCC|nr:hypothetical protein [Caenimonas soli]NPC58539.1 hypothetical protein [Caenimonas soli]